MDKARRREEINNRDKGEELFVEAQDLAREALSLYHKVTACNIMVTTYLLNRGMLKQLSHFICQPWNVKACLHSPMPYRRHLLTHTTQVFIASTCTFHSLWLPFIRLHYEWHTGLADCNQ